MGIRREVVELALPTQVLEELGTRGASSVACARRGRCAALRRSSRRRGLRSGHAPCRRGRGPDSGRLVPAAASRPRAPQRWARDRCPAPGPFPARQRDEVRIARHQWNAQALLVGTGLAHPAVLAPGESVVGEEHHQCLVHDAEGACRAGASVRIHGASGSSRDRHGQQPRVSGGRGWPRESGHSLTRREPPSASNRPSRSAPGPAPSPSPVPRT